MSKIKMMFAFGTRPEAIKLAPLVRMAEERKDQFETTVIVTAQHRKMLDDVLACFEIHPDRDLDIMAPDQSLFHVTSRIVTEMEAVIKEFDPQILLIQGDTTTTFITSLCAFYAGKRIAHVEAGLRTGNKKSPFPEEVNRKMTSVIADYHFAPTESARENLLKEGYDDAAIYVTGNTVIDALLWTVRSIKGEPCPAPGLASKINKYSRFVLVTMHRRESFGAPIKKIFSAFKKLSIQNPQVAFVYPVHMNPNVNKAAHEILGGIANFFLTPPLPHSTFCWFMNHCHFIITDSGGIQEEATALGKPLLVTRQVTERGEAVKEGMVKLVGFEEDTIVQMAQMLLDDKAFHRSMVKGYSPYGDGKAAERILDVLASE